MQRFAGLKVAVFGDLMMDEYVFGQANRVSPESPVLVVEVEREASVPGGAANVGANVMALGGKALVFGVVGDDACGQDLRTGLESHGADVCGVVTDASRPTTRKTRILAQSQQVLRIDRERIHATPSVASQELLSRFAECVDGAQAVLVSDYAKGVVNETTVPAVVTMSSERSVPVVANAKPDNAHLYAGASLVTLNLAEALAASGDKRFKEDDVETAGSLLREKIGCKALVVTRGAKGLCVWEDGGAHFSVPARPVEVYDVAGAGDTVVTTFAMTLAAGGTLREAAELAVRAAAVVVGKVGVATVTAEELLAHLED